MRRHALEVRHSEDPASALATEETLAPRIWVIAALVRRSGGACNCCRPGSESLVDHAQVSNARALLEHLA